MNKNYVLDNVKDFHLNQVLECGQCFHFARTDNGLNPDEYEYEIVARNRILHIKEEPSSDGVKLIFSSSVLFRLIQDWKVSLRKTAESGFLIRIFLKRLFRLSFLRISRFLR